MARVSHRWPFGHPSTSELDQVMLALAHPARATVFAFLLGAYYCLISCVKNFRIQYTYIAVASIDNPLSRSNRYLPELGTKIQTEITTTYNMPF